MKHKRMLLGLLFCFLVLSSLPLIAQELQTGTIRGTVTDENGQALPGVSIVVTGPALLGKVSVMTNEAGMFRAPALPPGRDYEVRAELEGIETVIRGGLIVNVGSVVTISLQMKSSTLQEEVTVVASSPTVDVVRSTKSTRVTSDILSSLPLTRDFSSLLIIAP